METINRMIGNYLRRYCAVHLDDWDQLLTSAELDYNSTKDEALRMLQFEIKIGWAPKSSLETLALH